MLTQTLDAMDKIKKSFPQTLKDCLGIITAACAREGIARQTYYNWREADPEFAAKCDESEDTTCDFVENQLLKRIKDEDTAAIIFYCKTKMRNRGYIERKELEHSGNQQKPIQIVSHYSKDQLDEMLDAISDES